MESYLVYFFCYLMGSIPFGFLLSKFFGVGDIRKIGSGNIGATNVLRSGNKKLAFFTLFFDFIKGFLPVILVSIYLPKIQFLAGVMCVLGHMHPLWLRFKGGKGVATGLGIYFAWSFYLGIFTVLIWLLVAKFSKKSSLSALIGFFLSIFINILLNFFSKGSSEIFVLITVILIFFAHRTNIIRLYKGEEKAV